MKTKLMIVLLLQCYIFACVSASSKEVYTQYSGTLKEINLTKFKKLHFDLFIKLKVVEGSDYTFSFQGDENLISLIECKQEGDLLTVRLTDCDDELRNRITATLTMPTSLEEIKISGMSTVHLMQKITAGKFTAESSGMSKLYITRMFAPHFIAKISGMSKLDVVGETRTINVNSSEMSDVNALSLQSKNAIVNCSGMSNANVWAEEELFADCSGMSKIVYKGAPMSKDKNVSGMSSIKQK